MWKKVWTILLAVPILATAQFRFEHTPENRWILSNGIIEATFAYTEKKTFEFESIRSLKTGDSWQAAQNVISSPVRFATIRTAVDAYIPLNLVDATTVAIDKKGMRQTLVFEESGGGFRIYLHLEMYENQPVLRYSVRVKNNLDASRRVRLADMLSWRFDQPAGGLQMMRVNQWSVLPPLGNFQPIESSLKDGNAVRLTSGASEQECAWIAIRDANNRGLVAGWEFDGKTEAGAEWSAKEKRLTLSAQIADLNRRLEPGEEFQVPPAFIGLFHGDWDEAGYRTQRFVENVLGKTPPEGNKFPYAVWDSWAYRTDIHEEVLRRNAEQAARMGMELFIVDLGWAQGIGDWQEDPEKFPSGLRALSDYVHSLGMKFGLHIAPAEAAANSPVVRDHSDWLATEPNSYFGAKSICLSHKPAQEWVLSQILRVIDDYAVDWILQDGEHMVKQCTRTDHTHDPEDSNYSNAVEGLDALLEAVQIRRPNTSWENCANGGSMMTFNMVKRYVTSITNDASGARAARQAVYGATYPFPPRYSDRYMPEMASNTYETRSYMFGGPWIFMNKLVDMTAEQQKLAESEIRTFKQIRGQIGSSKVFHLTAGPAEGRTDAIQGHLPELDSSVVVVTRDLARGPFTLKPGGLNPEKTYMVRFQSDSRVLTMTGGQLMNDGVPITLPQSQSAEIVYLEPADRNPENN